MRWFLRRLALTPPLCRDCGQPMRYSFMCDWWQCGLCEHAVGCELLWDRPRIWRWRHVTGL